MLYLLAAQYPSGGWPMYFPLRTSPAYTRHITFNDNAMIGVMRLLRDVAQASRPLDFVDAPRRNRAQQAIDKGLAVILQCQVRVDGRLTAWCAQHDEHDFAPRPARAFEPASLSGYESVGIVAYLMGLDDPSPDLILAVRSAVEWFASVQIKGIAVVDRKDALLPGGFDRVVVEDASAPPLWARFYEIGTNQPMFVGRDSVVKRRLADIEHERRVGYVWLGPFASNLLERDYPAWLAKWKIQ